MAEGVVEERGLKFLNGFSKQEQAVVAQILASYLPERVPLGFNYWLFYRLYLPGSDERHFVARRFNWRWEEAFKAETVEGLAHQLEAYYTRNELDLDAQTDRTWKEAEQVFNSAQPQQEK